MFSDGAGNSPQTPIIQPLPTSPAKCCLFSNSQNLAGGSLTSPPPLGLLSAGLNCVNSSGVTSALRSLWCSRHTLEVSGFTAVQQKNIQEHPDQHLHTENGISTTKQLISLHTHRLRRTERRRQRCVVCRVNVIKLLFSTELMCQHQDV